MLSSSGDHFDRLIIIIIIIIIIGGDIEGQTRSWVQQQGNVDGFSLACIVIDVDVVIVVAGVASFDGPVDCPLVLCLMH
jgi:hypothetical protein